ncbi:MAG: Rieske (2Fe-2S) protein [Actinobacteria bacterium]|nr:Rieske (2Fe-2S) protein [Actinomycetota bacterium]
MSAEGRRYVVARVHELPPGARKLVTIERREIGVFNVGGEFFALRNRCPHQGASLCAGRLVPVVQSRAPGDHKMGDQTLLQCPWHGWEFDIRDGQSWCDPGRLRVRSYDVEVERGDEVGDSERIVDGLVMGPYRADSYPVAVEDGDVVVRLG